jgi:hypothetical protein
MQMKTRKISIAACVLVFVVVALFMSNMAISKGGSSQHAGDIEVNVINFDVLPQYMQGLRTAVTRVLRNKNLNAEEINKIDFSFPVKKGSDF